MPGIAKGAGKRHSIIQNRSTHPAYPWHNENAQAIPAHREKSSIQNNPFTNNKIHSKAWVQNLMAHALLKALLRGLQDLKLGKENKEVLR